MPWAVAGANARTEDGEAAESEGEKLTKEIDALGMRWLCMALYPLVGAWGVYSLLYYPHKSWWSWLINTLANGVCKPPGRAVTCALRIVRSRSQSRRQPPIQAVS